MYDHATLRVNFTTYNVQRDADVIKGAWSKSDDRPRSERCDVMVLSSEDKSSLESHPFWYARVLRIFHVNVYQSAVQGSKAKQRMDVCWVRWFGRDPEYSAGWNEARLDRVGFVPESPEAFGFLDPKDIIRACHLIPAFHHKRTKDLLGPSKARENKGDYQYFYVNWYEACLSLLEIQVNSPCFSGLSIET
jgi:hypothetical protein